MRRGILLVCALSLAGCADFGMDGEWQTPLPTNTVTPTPTPIGTPTPTVGDPTALRINEVLAYVPTAMSTAGDANGDGKSDASDQFVEIVNTSSDPVPLAGVSLVIGSPARSELAFPNQAFIQGGGVLMVFSNGSLTTGPDTCSASSVQMGTLALKGQTDKVSLVWNANPIDQASWTNNAYADTSWTRSPDVTGSFDVHPLVTDASGDLRSFSPGCRIDATPF